MASQGTQPDDTSSIANQSQTLPQTIISGNRVNAVPFGVADAWHEV